MGLLQQLTEKSWVATEGKIVDPHDRRAFLVPTATLGLRVFLAVVTVLFSLLIVGYADRMGLGDWRALPEPWLLWLNTLVLLLSSGGLQWALASARRHRIEGMKAGILAGGGFAFAFIVGQLFAWRVLVDAGYYVATNPANAFFYLITGLHGLHLLGGLVALARTSEKVWRGVDPAHASLSVELCAVYWHFLLLVWLILFALLLAT